MPSNGLAKSMNATYQGPSSPQFYFNKGYTQFLNKRYNHLKIYLKSTQPSRLQSDAHYYLGHIAYQLENYDEATQSFEKFQTLIKKRP